MKLDGGCPAQPRHCCVGLQAEDLDQQHGSRGPKRDNQSRHYTAENVEVIVVIRLMAAVGLRLRSIHGGLLRNGGVGWGGVGWTGCICCMRVRVPPIALGLGFPASVAGQTHRLETGGTIEAA
jgi:hypothetical protein